jgi:hypothetical protein
MYTEVVYDLKQKSTVKKSEIQPVSFGPDSILNTSLNPKNVQGFDDEIYSQDEC